MRNMVKIERVREVLNSPSSEYFNQKAAEGWKMVAVEWEREAGGAGQRSPVMQEDIPFGLRVGDDCMHLVENAAELQVLYDMMELIVQDSHLIRVADELNSKGYRNRNGAKWNAASVFALLPRLVEVGPQIFTSEEWIARRQHLFYVS